MGYTTPEEEGRQQARERIDNNLSKILEIMSDVQTDIIILSKGNYNDEYQGHIAEAGKMAIKQQSKIRSIKKLIA